MRIAICDDNKDELVLISSILDTYQQERHFTMSYRTFHSATALLSSAKSGAYDLYLLDVIMPVIDGLEVAREIRSFDKVGHIIFLTAAPEFAAASYSVKADNYLLKPIGREKLCFALDNLNENVDRQEQATIVVKSSDGLEKLLLSQLVYVEALNRRVIYHTASGKAISCVGGFSEVCQELLNYSEFVKPHRSYLVNMSYLDTIKNTEILLQTGGSLPIAQRRTAAIKERYLTFQMEAYE